MFLLFNVRMKCITRCGYMKSLQFGNQTKIEILDIAVFKISANLLHAQFFFFFLNKKGQYFFFRIFFLDIAS